VVSPRMSPANETLCFGATSRYSPCIPAECLEVECFEAEVLKLSAGRLPRLDATMPSRADRFDTTYLRAAQAYMLISMPTGTSTILGVFQVIAFSPR
jgi:hypothetical protein